MFLPFELVMIIIDYLDYDTLYSLNYQNFPLIIDKYIVKKTNIFNIRYHEMMQKIYLSKQISNKIKHINWGLIHDYRRWNNHIMELSNQSIDNLYSINREIYSLNIDRIIFLIKQNEKNNDTYIDTQSNNKIIYNILN